MIHQGVEERLFPGERTRALIGVALYAAAGVLGDLIAIPIALAIFLALPIFPGVTSDGGYREERVVALNCIHAVSDVDREGGPLRTWADYGERAARRIVLHFGRWIKEAGRDRPGVWERIWRETWRPDPTPDALTIRGGMP